MGYKRTGELPGPKPTFSRTLGKGVTIGHRLPPPIHDLLIEVAVKKLLNRMALEEGFKARILAQVEAPLE